jgi:murein L,D-transpeptidase YcbB/YkuD
MKFWHLLILVFAFAAQSCEKNVVIKADFDDYLGSLDTASYTAKVHSLCDSFLLDKSPFAKIYINKPDSIRAFFSNNSNVLKWWSGNSQLFFKNLSAWYTLVDVHGLDSNYYHAAYINECRGKILTALDIGGKPSMDTLAMMEILMADGLYASLHDIQSGRITPAYALTANVIQKNRVATSIGQALKKDIFNQLSEAVPQFKEYQNLQAHLKRFKGIPKNAFIENKKHTELPTDSISQVDLLARLVALNAIELNDSIFRKPSSKLLKEGLFAFGKTGENDSLFITEKLSAALDFDAEQRQEKIALNLERWRWTGAIEKGHKVWVNIARNELDAYRNDTLILTMRVCTGKARSKKHFLQMEKYLNGDSNTTRPWKNQETPIFKSKLTHLYAMPNWYIPKSILFNELLWKIRKDPGHINKLGYKLQTYSGDDVDPYSIDWHKVRKETIPVRLVQPGGNKNALGKLKVIFNNPFSVYCHDTPQKWAFSRDNRHVSHGCVRLKSPFKFAEYISSCQKKNQIDQIYMAAGKDPLIDTSLMSLRAIEEADTAIVDKKYGVLNNERFNLDTRIPIYIVYFTCEVKEDGALHFIADGYSRDVMMKKAMQKPRSAWNHRERKNAIVKKSNS